MTRVAFFTCHLSGTGHMVRTLSLARAVQAAGDQALVISGGRPLPHIAAKDIELVQLPPLSVENLDFSRLLTEAGTVADEAYLDDRRQRLCSAIGRFAPDVLVTELYPLGRRRLASEFEAAIAAARSAAPNPAIVASVRDVPEPPSRPARLAEAAARLGADFDALLVHGDAAVLPLERSWPLPAELAPLIRYTGYVGRDAPVAPGRRTDEVLVSVGSGTLGRRLVALAAEAARHATRPWRLLLGGADAAARARAIMRDGAPNLIAEPARGDFPALLASAACSVSLAGYNTVMDLARCDTPALLVPSEEGGEREQLIRAQALAARGGFALRREAGLTPEELAALAEELAIGPRRVPLGIALDGAARTATILRELARERGITA